MALRSFAFAAMASPCHLHLDTADDLLAELAAEAAIAEVQRIEQHFSRYRGDSELSRINRVADAGGEIEVDAETAALLDFAFAAYDKSAGLFDITSGLLRRAWDFSSARLPDEAALAPLREHIGMDHLVWKAPRLGFARPGMEIDFGGIGKEYAVDRAVETLRSFGIAHGLVDLGGDIGVTGPRISGAPWQVTIRHPREDDAVLAEVPLASGGLASSGDYERFMEIDGARYCHILDPRTGMSCHGLMAVTVAAPNCLAAGALATTAMLKGEEGVAWLGSLDTPHLYVDAEGVQGGTLLVPQH